MFRQMVRHVGAGVLVIAVATMTGAAWGESPEDLFHRAYFLEREAGDVAGAAALYEKALAAGRLDPGLRRQAETRLAGCREEVAATDFAALMPPDVFAYVEVTRPADQVIRLIDNLGLLRHEGEAAGDPQKRVAISPALIDAFLGMRGLAVGINGIEFENEDPPGIVIFHPGDIDLVRGLIETGLPIAGQPVDPVGGFPTYNIEDDVFVTLTNRLVVLSPKIEQIEGVIRRLKGEETTSLATSPAAAELVRGRGDSLVYAFVETTPIMPMIKGLMTAAAAQDPDVAMAQAVLDPESLRSVVGRVAVTEDGLRLEIELRLAEGHRNLVYNFLRTPAINEDTLDSIPHGVAAFVAGALNERSSRFVPASQKQSGSPPVVTGLDLGREIFGNMAGIALFVMPPEGEASKGRAPIPDIGAAISVNDPSQSEAIWMQILGLASMATGTTTTLEGQAVDIAGVPVRMYQLPEGVSLYFATMDDHVLVASSESAMARSIGVRQGGKSVRHDTAFANSLSRIGPTSTKAVFVHPARCVEVGRPFMSKSEFAEVKPFLGTLSETVASLVIDHSDKCLRFSAELTGIPDVGAVVSRMVGLEEQGKKRRGRLDKAIKQHQWDQAIAAIDEMLADRPDDASLLKRKFRVLAVGKKDRQTAIACAKEILERDEDNANALNNFAWALLTEEKYDGQYNEIALEFSERSNELTRHKNWAYVDTLALARFLNGDAKGAVESEEKAIALAGDRASEELQKALARFKAGLQ